ncbi:hypothetical protein BV22DRAFT_1020693 [Leucogyrophana mollusca]|uniref:Uncharacterized protein n=1 Tax=Leucogyrophana mollusca TaxID=85980 RepID=A0ACB8B5D3_9AGAM|nr:hypothetical protein BV22DRAFT_1020693 [Leucogyrophana mollusca]
MNLSVLASYVKTATYHLYTMYLFTKSDVKTILLPITIFAVAAAPTTSLCRFVHCTFWTWFHLLQFCVSNQCLSPEEDARNKPWRPIPSLRLSVTQASALRWALLPLCLLVSACYNVMTLGIIFATSVILHNELKLGSHWFTRNALNAMGYATFDSAATLIAQTDRTHTSDASAITAYYISTLVIFTTIHAQDFQDEKGDRWEGRRTIPIVMPEAGRISMPVTLIFWSVLLSFHWGSSTVISGLLLSLGTLVGLRFTLLRTPEADRISYILYNVWLAIARIVPLYCDM